MGEIYGQLSWAASAGVCGAATTNRRLDRDEVEDAAGCTTTQCVPDEWEKVLRYGFGEDCEIEEQNPNEAGVSRPHRSSAVSRTEEGDLLCWQ